ncbi:MAG: Nramp family divalent metal transporter [Planctomycetes bacterium]|nr:Nramp family divalent metal transporter [Planctomycetota bacterium]
MADAHASHSPTQTSVAPHPGSREMPRWNVGELPDAPQFHWSSVWQFLGPGLLMGGAAIGGGEWLQGPLTTARYGGGLLWLSTLSILGQVLYNIEISRYTLYSGEPIFTGKFRTLPGPMFWVFFYLALDFGAIFPYLAASAATPLAMMIGKVETTKDIANHATLLQWLSVGIFLASFIPLIFGGKIYNSLKAVMTFKLVTVMGFLLVLAIGYSHLDTWVEIFSGFFKFGTVPVGETELDNVFVAMWQGRKFPELDLTMMATLSALVAISGQGGLSNTPISNYTRDSGWGMGSHVGAIPSMVGGHDIQLSHVGTVFEVTETSLPRWKRWYRHLMRDQLCVWMPACFFGLALPSMLSVEFLPKHTVLSGSEAKWAASVMTATAVGDRVGGSVGDVFRFLTLFCGFLVLSTCMASTIDGFVRRWVDVFWTASKKMHAMGPEKIRYLYFGVLVGYAILGLVMLTVVAEPKKLIEFAGVIYNFALGFSCFHVAVLNTILLPAKLRPHPLIKLALWLVGAFFTSVGAIALYKMMYDAKLFGLGA